MKRVTFTADQELVARARSVARSQGKTLNSAFREWLVEFTAAEGDARNYDALMKNLHHIRAGHRFTREELNER